MTEAFDASTNHRCQFSANIVSLLSATREHEARGCIYFMGDYVKNGSLLIDVFDQMQLIKVRQEPDFLLSVLTAFEIAATFWSSRRNRLPIHRTSRTATIFNSAFGVHKSTCGTVYCCHFLTSLLVNIFKHYVELFIILFCVFQEILVP